VDTQSNNNINMMAMTLPVFDGVNLQVDAGSAEDYLHLRSRQLSALTHVMAGESFYGWNNSIKVGVASLASSLADEVDNLIPLVMREARRPQGNSA
jgi:hypothetical protein